MTIVAVSSLGRLLLFAAGFLVPLPLFINIKSGDIFLSRAVSDSDAVAQCVGYTTIFPNAVPVGYMLLMASLLMYGTLKMGTAASKWLIASAVIFVGVLIFNFHILVGAPLIRAASLAHFAFMLPLSIFVYANLRQCDRTSLTGGFRAGSSLYLFLVFLEHGLRGFDGQGHCLRFFYDYEIYQSLVSYPTVLCLLAFFHSRYVAASFCSRARFSAGTALSLIAVFVACSILVGFSKRASLLVLTLAGIFYIAEVWHWRNFAVPLSARIAQVTFAVLFLFCAALIGINRDIFDSSTYSARFETLHSAVVEHEQRDGAASESPNTGRLVPSSELHGTNFGIHVQNQPPGSATDLDEGEAFAKRVAEENWGGRSSFLLELLYRQGSFGLFVFFAYFGVILLWGMELLKGENINNSKLSSDLHARSQWVFGLEMIYIFSIIFLENIFNSHIQLPFFTTAAVLSVLALEVNRRRLT